MKNTYTVDLCLAKTMAALRSLTLARFEKASFRTTIEALIDHKYRTHLSLEKDAPEPRPIQAVNFGEIVEIPEVGGLHHHYERRAA